ncbi:carboxypeptidase-like regulatory domain-containing protein [Puteibacter caeruleilacunae]|nr:carboxypeptidase-like regulatory domain-containing protein [Puteibacter caeruleilacunae]
MKLLLPVICLFFTLINLTFGQQISGTIKDPQGNPIPYVNIYVPELKTGTISNIDGNYQLDLSLKQDVKVVFQYLGYQTYTTSISPSVDNKSMVINIILQRRSMNLKEIKVLASGEDPAYYVMRRAIAMAPYYRRQVSEYNCKVYLKGTGVLDKIPGLLKRKLKKEGLEEDKPFVMENISKVHFELPDKIQEEVIAMHSSGDDNNTSPMSMVTSNLYQTTNYGLISPLDKSAMQVYRFKLIGVFEDQGELVNKIAVIPKRKGKDLFRGFINILENYWSIHSADLRLSLPMTDITMHQLYAPVNDNTWLPVSMDFDIDFGGMGFHLLYKYVASITEYQTTLNPNLDHSILAQVKEKKLQDEQVLNQFQSDKSSAVVETVNESINDILVTEELNNRKMRKAQRKLERELSKSQERESLEIVNRLKINKDALQNDSSYWASMRPIALTTDEIESFGDKDSIVTLHNSPAYKDSIRARDREFKAQYILTGKYYRYKNDSAKYSASLNTPGVLDPTAISFNTVDGFKVKLPFRYAIKDTTDKELYVDPVISYAFSRKKFDAQLGVMYKYNGLKNASVSLEGGRVVIDYNELTGMPVLLNNVYTLLFEENYKKYYQKDFVVFRHNRELLNGLDFRGALEWQKRSTMTNHSSYKLINRDDVEYTPNIPENNTLETYQLNNSKHCGLEIGLTYTPRRRYRLNRHHKIPAGSKYPTFALKYKKGISGLFDGDTDYDFLNMAIYDNFKLGLKDYFSYVVSGGVFLNDRRLYMQDFKHFATNATEIMIKHTRPLFRGLPYYEYSTDDYFLQGNFNWSSDRLVVKRLPVFNNTLISESIFVNTLKSGDKDLYWECGYGVNNILLLFDLEFVTSFVKDKHQISEFRIGINLH